MLMLIIGALFAIGLIMTIIEHINFRSVASFIVQVALGGAIGYGAGSLISENAAFIGVLLGIIITITVVLFRRDQIIGILRFLITMALGIGICGGIGYLIKGSEGGVYGGILGTLIVSLIYLKR